MSEQKGKPGWWIKPLEHNFHHGCLNCGGTARILDLETRLYNGFGGWKIEKDGEFFFQEDPSIEKKWEDYKQLQEIEKIVKRNPDHDWRAIFDLPTRGGTYQRHGNNKWVLVESNRGFA